MYKSIADMVKSFNCCCSDQTSGMGMKRDLSDFDHGMIVGARWGGFIVSETALKSLHGMIQKHPLAEMIEMRGEWQDWFKLTGMQQ